MRKALNALWLASENVLRLLIGLAVISLIARHLGPQQFGVYVYLFSFVSLFLPIAMFGLEAVVLRRCSEDPGMRDVTIGTAAAIRAVSGVGAAAIFVCLVIVVGGPDGMTLGLASLAALTLTVAPAETFYCWFKASERMALVAVPRFVTTLAAGGLTVVMVWGGAGLSGLVAIRAVEAIAFLVVAILVYGLNTRGIWRLSFDWYLVTLFLKQGFPLLIAGVSTLIYMRIDQVMLGHLSTAAELGLYGVATRVADAALFLPAVLQSVFYASLVRAHARDAAGFDDHIQRFYDLTVLIGIVTMAGVALLGWLLLIPVFGTSYAGSRPMLMVLTLALPFFFMFYGWGTMVTIRGWFWTAPLLTGIGALLNVGLNLVLIRPLGGLGAAWATVISYSFAGYALLFAVGYLRPTAIGLTRSLDAVGASRRLYALWMAREHS